MSKMEFLGALEAEKLTTQKWEQYFGTPCKMILWQLVRTRLSCFNVKTNCFILRKIIVRLVRFDELSLGWLS